METKRELRATLDACIIFHLAACDTLLHASEAGLYEPLWSSRILDEVVRTARLVLQPDKHAGLSRRISDMNYSFPQSSLDAPSEIENQIKPFLTDPDDAHVIATALVAKSDFIVTENLKDFPSELLTPLGIRAISFDAFMSYLFDIDAAKIHRGLVKLTAEKANPAISILEHLLQLETLSPQFNKKVREYLHLSN